jgi:hypothetical protein
MTKTTQKQLDSTRSISTIYLYSANLMNTENTIANFKTHQQEIDA